MRRDIKKLVDGAFDLLVIGGGIYGVCVAYEASQRGLTVALIDKADFGGATSANSLKIIHGGLRYLQHADLARMRESIRERRTLLRIAPHLIHPLPVAIPTYGHGLKGQEVMRVAMVLNDLVSADRNWIQDQSQHIPAGQTISRSEALKFIPGLRQEGLTGAAVFHDAQVYNSERLTLAFAQSADVHGAVLANYVEATNLLQANGEIRGARARDVLTGESFDIRAKMTVLTAGPWVGRLLDGLSGKTVPSKEQYAKAINIITRPLIDHFAVGVSGTSYYRDHDAVVNKGSRLFFLAPWRGYSLIGTAYFPCGDDPDSFSVTQAELEQLITDVNNAYPGGALLLSDVRLVHRGLLPISGVDPASGDVRLVKHYRLDDMRAAGLRGLVSVTGVKYTTARDVAEKTVDHIFRTWGWQPPESTSAQTPLYGADIDQFNKYLHDQEQKQPCGISPSTVRSLVMNYGTVYDEVIAGCETLLKRDEPEQLVVLRAQIRHAVKEEMAIKLSDVVMRRTDLGSAGFPGLEVLRFCAECMAGELGWTQARVEHEFQEVQRIYAPATAVAPFPSTLPEVGMKTDGAELAGKVVR